MDSSTQKDSQPSKKEKAKDDTTKMAATKEEKAKDDTTKMPATDKNKWLMIIVHADRWHQETGFLLPWPENLPEYETFHIFELVGDDSWGTKPQESASHEDNLIRRLTSLDGLMGWDSLKRSVKNAGGLVLGSDPAWGPMGGEGFPEAIHGVLHVDI